MDSISVNYDDMCKPTKYIAVTCNFFIHMISLGVIYYEAYRSTKDDYGDVVGFGFATFFSAVIFLFVAAHIYGLTE